MRREKSWTLLPLLVAGMLLGCSRDDAPAQSTDSSKDSDAGSDTNSEHDTDTDEGNYETDTEEYPTWLIHISDNKLWHIDIHTAVATKVCDLKPQTDVALPTFQSVTFTRVDDRLMASSSSDDSLWEVFLPSCDIEKIGDYTNAEGQAQKLAIPGICPSKQGNNLYGISKTASALFFINSDTAVVTEIGPLGQVFGNLGATWADSDRKIYSIANLSQGADGLLQVDETTGAASLLFELPVDFGSVGMEYHPHNGMVYACTNPEVGTGYESAPLFRVDIAQQTVELVGLTGLPGNCDNLGAPYGNPALPVY
jgi:hypothetical protein